jgi:hypothetical protein
LLLARNQQEALRLLHSTLYHAVEDFGENSITPYIENGWHYKWPPHLEALQSISIADIDAGQVHMLVEMKVAAMYATAVLARLPDWDPAGAQEMIDLKQLNHYHTMTGLTVGFLSTQRQL